MPSHKQAFFLALCLFLSIPISAQTTKTSPEKWPSRPVRMIVPFAPGGLDVIARKVALKLGEQLNISGLTALLALIWLQNRHPMATRCSS